MFIISFTSVSDDIFILPNSQLLYVSVIITVASWSQEISIPLVPPPVINSDPNFKSFRYLYPSAGVCFGLFFMR